MRFILPGATTRLARSGASILVVIACAGIMPAQAASRKVDYNLNAKIEAICAVGQQVAPMTLTTTVDKNGKLDPALVNRSFVVDGMLCSGPSQITVSATSLRLSLPRNELPTGQSQTVNFITSATGWTSNPATVTTRDSTPLGSLEVYAGVPQVQYNAKSGGITIHVSGFAVVTEKAANGRGTPAKPVDGNYAATITISLTPKS